ncbi:MAG: 30S ribosomal protein S11 [Candidatus Brennerbacteria bacterium]|nr:30S ribosomal protein S11 [Candidatus Brennerbacteria bacterium]
MGKKKVAAKSQEELVKESEAVEATAAKESAKSVSTRLSHGRIYVNASYNNTMITVTDEKGGVVAWMSSGSLGFSGPKKATPFAASKVAEAIAEKVRKSGPLNVEIFVRGIGKGRDSAVRTLAAKGFVVESVKDITPIPHNGPRPRKTRRV